MFLFTLLLLIHIWTAVKSDCGSAPSVALTCEHNHISANWSSGGCNHFWHCVGDLSCTNGTSQYVPHNPEAICPGIFVFDIPMEYYYCNVTVYYQYRTPDYTTITSPETLKSCAYSKIELQNDNFENQTVGKPDEVFCILHTGQVLNSSDVSISWIGPDGVIANESSRITVIPTATSDGYIHTSTLQFSYISEDDENTSYSCIASINGNNKSVSYQIGNLFIPTPTVRMTVIENETVGYNLSMRCDIHIAKGIYSSVNIIWKIRNVEKRKITVAGSSFHSINMTSLKYTDFLSVQLTDNNTVYYCQAVINASSSLSASDNLTLKYNASVTASSITTDTNSQPTPQNVSNSSPVNRHRTDPTAAIVISSIAAFLMIGFLFALFTICHQKEKRLLLSVLRKVRKGDSGDDDQLRIPNFDDNDYSVIGKDEPSAVEYLKYDRVTSDSQMSKIDEECSSIYSQTDFITNKEILIRVNGGDASEKQHHKTSKLDTSMSPKKGLPIASTTSDTEDLHSSPSGDHIQSSESPYFDDSIALQQHSMSPLSDPNESYSGSLPQLQSSEDPQIVSISNNDNLGGYVADSMAIDQYNVAPVDLGYLDTAVNQHTTNQAVPYLSDADMDMKIHKSSDSFPYIEDPIASMPCINDQLGSSCNAHGDTKEKDHNDSDLSSYLQKVTVASSQAMDGVYVDHSFPV